MTMPGRSYSAGNGYRYGFNGKENDNDVKGFEGSQQDYGMRVYDPRIGKFLSLDPLARNYAWNSPYSYAEGDVIRCVDLDGLEKYLIIYEPVDGTSVAKLTITTVGNIEAEALENMKISFNDNSPNDQSQYVLRIKNNMGFTGRLINTREQANDKQLTRHEGFLYYNGVKEMEDNSDIVIQVKDQDKNGKEKVVGESIKFDPSKFVHGESVGFIGAMNIKETKGINDYDETVGSLMKDFKKVTGADTFSNVLITISTDKKLDKDVTDSYSNTLKEKYGSNIKIKWTQTSDVTEETKGKSNTNITITVIK